MKVIRARVYIEKILAYIETTDNKFFKNNVTTREKLSLRTYQVATAVKFLTKKSILINYSTGCYEINRSQLGKFRKSKGW